MHRQEQSAIQLILEGHTCQQVADLLGTSVSYVSRSTRDVRSAMGRVSKRTKKAEVVEVAELSAEDKVQLDPNVLSIFKARFAELHSDRAPTLPNR